MTVEVDDNRRWLDFHGCRQGENTRCDHVDKPKILGPAVCPSASTQQSRTGPSKPFLAASVDGSFKSLCRRWRATAVFPWQNRFATARMASNAGETAAETGNFADMLR